MSKLKSKLLLVLVVIFALVGLLLSGCGGEKQKQAVAPAEQKGKTQEKVVIKFASSFPMESNVTESMKLFKEKAEKNSNGRLEVQLYPGSQLYADKEMWRVLGEGGIEMAWLNPDIGTGIVPSLGLTYFPCYFDDRDHHYRMLNGEPGQIIGKDIEGLAKAKVLSWGEFGSVGVISRKPIKTLEDWKGLRIRSPGQFTGIFIKEIGSAPTPISSAELYQAMQRGIVEGAYTAVPGFYSRKLFEVAKYVPDTYVSTVGIILGASVEFWNKLPAELQKIVLEAAQEAGKYAQDTSLRDDAAAIEKVKAAGVQFIPISPEEKTRWRKATLPKMSEELKKQIGEEKAQKLLDAVEALRKK
jgi:TRAP-type C4-dicarboxylate transport system substrate-binding protein